MKIKPILICFVLFLVSMEAYGERHSHTPKRNNTDRTTLLDPAEEDYDIKHLKFDLDFTDTSLAIKGNVTTTAQVVVPSMSTYVFELDTLITIDSAKINGTLVSVSTAPDFVRTITLPTALSSGATFDAQIYYHGVPPPGGGFFNGLTHAVSGAGTNMLYTISDPWVALVWWPTKQDVTDKIDSVDMYVTVPAHQVDGSNGVLVGVDSTTNPGSWQYHWQTHYPITYYLISIAISQYWTEQSYMHFTGSTDSMLIQNFFMDTATFNPVFRPSFDSLPILINYFSSLYGRYPFWHEKYGVCYTNLQGGMEHQTMTTIGLPNRSYSYIIAHELTHQWFGDNVSYASWHEVWLSEAFATYAEQLYLTEFNSAAAGKAHRLSLLSTALNRPCGMVYINDTTTADSLFDQATVYDKGEGVLSTLRYIAPTDSQFFQVLKNYQQMYAQSNATTTDLKNIAEAVYGVNLDTFFNQWIYGRGYPKYKVSWNQQGSLVYVRLIQSQSCASYTSHFNTPLELELNAGSLDTIVKVYNSQDTQSYVFDWSPTMTTMHLNPDALTICKLLGTVTHDTSLGVTAITESNIKIYPNPTTGSWQVSHLPGNSVLTLSDLTGRILWQGTSNTGDASIPGAELPGGNYVLRINSNSTSESVKLTRW